ncbi:unnamed protein product [Cylicocyclus nassatus]|uniref:Uncharacterized protein n=1 Tax=Cylicocyclus nassatus TaxID=53992 RepID=A0AA36H450_CYLNA|nr:unnamed protein product [Cylicocyclus nassatus]
MKCLLQCCLTSESSRWLLLRLLVRFIRINLHVRLMWRIPDEALKLCKTDLFLDVNAPILNLFVGHERSQKTAQATQMYFTHAIFPHNKSLITWRTTPLDQLSDESVIFASYRKPTVTAQKGTFAACARNKSMRQGSGIALMFDVNMQGGFYGLTNPMTIMM